MKRALILPLLLAACHAAPEQADTQATVETISLPDEPSAQSLGLPDAIAAKCTACHSPEMIAYQPAMPADKWAATVKKMREVYKAPLTEADEKPLAAMLTAYQASRSAPPSAPGK